MKIKHVLIISAFVLLVFGIGFLLAPIWSMGLFDVTLDPAGAMAIQLLAATFLGFATLNWLGRNYVVPDDVRSIILANFVLNVVSFVVLLIQKLDGLGNAWSWIPILLYLLFAVAYGYSIVVKSTYEEPTMRAKHA